jgi:hypothetical protein
MIQRIQSVFLFMIIVFTALYLAFPIWTSSPESEGTIFRLYSFFLYTGPSDNPETGTWTFWPYFISGAIGFFIIITSIVELLSYNKRMRQVKLGALNSVLLGAVIITSVVFITNNQDVWTAEIPGNFSIGIIFPVLAMICNVLANYFIRKDEKLVRSMDRIR